MKYSTVLFDLDGTLTDPVQGICGSVRYALEKAGRSVGPIESYHKYIGPPLLRSFEVYANATPEEAQELLGYYRERFSTVGLFENEVYPGIPEQLRRLRAQGYVLAIATCKPEYQAKPICQHFGLDDLVDDIYGASEDNSRLDKDQVIRYGFEKMGFDAARGDRALMVGDRWTDVEGAKACGLACLGCGWGYAEPGELAEHGAYRIIDAVDQLCDAVDDFFTPAR